MKLFFILIFSIFVMGEEILPSWSEGVTKQAIIEYVKRVTDKNSTDFVPKEDRIAVFDHDGTLWSEQPLYFQFFFAVDRVKELLPQHPEWKDIEPFKSVLAGEIDEVMKSGKEGILKLIYATHTGMSDEAFDAMVLAWIDTAKHPTKQVLFKDLVFQPMLELLNYLRLHKFKTFIVSGGSIDFMRPWATKVYGIPSCQIIGSELKVRYENGNILRLPQGHTLNDKKGKPVGIHYHIGKRPIAAFGNSDGDLEMLQYTDVNKKYRTFQLYVHHTDAQREWAYDRKSHIGRLNKGLDYAVEHHWTIVDIKNDWKVIYPFELRK